MKLYTFFFSSASFRVRIALHLKEISFETIGVNLREGAQKDAKYLADMSPSPLVPVLDTGSMKISQSQAIIDWLDREFPTPQLIPESAELRSKVLALSGIVACDIHPLNNPRVLKYLTGTLQQSDEAKQEWYEHWIETGFKAATRLLAAETGSYCFGNEPTIADCALIPQVMNAIRWNCDMSPFPRIMAIYEHAMEQPAFKAASPLAQPDVIK